MILNSSQMENKSDTLFTVMRVLAYIAFIGLSIEAGSFLFSFVFSLFKSPEESSVLYRALELVELQQHSFWDYFLLGTLITLIYGLKAHLAYLLIKIFESLVMKNPFQEKVVRYIIKLGTTALNTGFAAIFTNLYITQYLERRFELDIPVQFEVSELFFLAGIIFVLSKIFKRGVEIQSENELTV